MQNAITVVLMNHTIFREKPLNSPLRLYHRMLYNFKTKLHLIFKNINMAAIIPYGEA